MKFINIAKLFVSVGPKLKGWIFSDGKFQLNRALTLLAALVVMLVASQFVGIAELTAIINLLDEVSDIFGYVE